MSPEDVSRVKLLNAEQLAGLGLAMAAAEKKE
jgi:hypothetical protein